MGTPLLISHVPRHTSRAIGELRIPGWSTAPPLVRFSHTQLVTGILASDRWCRESELLATRREARISEVGHDGHHSATPISEVGHRGEGGASRGVMRSPLSDEELASWREMEGLVQPPRADQRATGALQTAKGDAK